MSNPQVYNDGNVPFGVPAQPITMQRGANANLGTYILESFTPSRPTKKVTRPGAYGEPNGFALVPDYNTASGVLQIALASTVFPQTGDFFTLTVDPNVPNEKWVIESISQPFEMQGYYKQNITCIKPVLS